MIAHLGYVKNNSKIDTAFMADSMSGSFLWVVNVKEGRLLFVPGSSFIR
jgi:hypothetical protein